MTKCLSTVLIEQQLAMGKEMDRHLTKTKEANQIIILIVINHFNSMKEANKVLSV